MQEKTLTFELTISQANAVLQALVNSPYAVAAPIIDLMKVQASSQLNQAEEESAPSPEAE